jgi:hypothetical protein
MNVSSQRSRLFLSSSLRKTRQIRSHTPCSSHSFSRRKQLEGLGSSASRSRHRAAVLRTYRIPSKTARLGVQGRPSFGWRLRSGSRGSIFAHSLSVRRTPRRGIADPSPPTVGLETRDRLQGYPPGPGYDTASSEF